MSGFGDRLDHALRFVAQPFAFSTKRGSSALLLLQLRQPLPDFLFKSPNRVFQEFWFPYLPLKCIEQLRFEPILANGQPV